MRWKAATPRALPSSVHTSYSSLPTHHLRRHARILSTIGLYCCQNSVVATFYLQSTSYYSLDSLNLEHELFSKHFHHLLYSEPNSFDLCFTASDHDHFFPFWNSGMRCKAIASYIHSYCSEWRFTDFVLGGRANASSYLKPTSSINWDQNYFSSPVSIVGILSPY
jgi:hypothetical protein